MKKLILAIVIGVALCIVILGNIKTKDSGFKESTNDTKLKQILKPDTNLIVKAKRYIGNISKDPNSIKYKNVGAFLDIEGNSYACGEFNAKNSFGAYVGYRKFIYNGSTMLMNGETKVPFSELEKKFCTYQEIEN
ncbi:hypothetical protein EA756_08535 [Acinetobacter lactucae]|uniref:Uncharacterized protein n=1 Tax=Acinetobacter lactucae TaxID=1785128 RepID=A0A3R9QHQ5_9GAMM|nr:hypothetical protein [Acinetobacter lactucae]RSO57531.1 hypothetical protein EA756_08535 [Acinetobacter lactucae]